MGNVATRLLSLILLLQTRPSWKAAELALELNVSERTIHRYMAMLEEMGIPIYSERGRHGGFSLVRGYKLPPLVFTAEEATVLYMGANLVRDVWGRTYGDAVTGVTAKLDNVLPDNLRQEVDAAQQSLVILGGLARMDYRLWSETIHTLRQCIGNRRCVHLLYRRAAHPQETSRVIEPYALAFQWGLWYLVGYCHLRRDLRTFRVDRIQGIEALEERFTVPRDFSVREYMERTMRSELAYKVEVHLEAEVAQAVREWHGDWTEIVDHPDGSITARFNVADLDWVSGWVMGFGLAAKVLKPPELVERVQTAAQGVLQRYAEIMPDTASR